MKTRDLKFQKGTEEEWSKVGEKKATRQRKFQLKLIMSKKADMLYTDILKG